MARLQRADGVLSKAVQAYPDSIPLLAQWLHTSTMLATLEVSAPSTVPPADDCSGDAVAVAERRWGSALQERPASTVLWLAWASQPTALSATVDATAGPDPALGVLRGRLTSAIAAIRAERDSVERQLVAARDADAAAGLMGQRPVVDAAAAHVRQRARLDVALLTLAMAVVRLDAEAGRLPQAVAALQALVEFNLFPPRSLLQEAQRSAGAAQARATRREFFAAYWDAEEGARPGDAAIDADPAASGNWAGWHAAKLAEAAGDTAPVRKSRWGPAEPAGGGSDSSVSDAVQCRALLRDALALAEESTDDGTGDSTGDDTGDGVVEGTGDGVAAATSDDSSWGVLQYRPQAVGQVDEAPAVPAIGNGAHDASGDGQQPGPERTSDPAAETEIVEATAAAAQASAEAREAAVPMDAELREDGTIYSATHGRRITAPRGMSIAEAEARAYKRVQARVGLADDDDAVDAGAAGAGGVDDAEEKAAEDSAAVQAWASAEQRAEALKWLPRHTAEALRVADAHAMDEVEFEEVAPSLVEVSCLDAATGAVDRRDMALALCKGVLG